MPTQPGLNRADRALHFGLFDFDNHYYEATDAFTRCAPKALGGRGVQWVRIGDRDRILVGGRLNSYVVRPTFDPVSKPGALYDWYRGIRASWIPDLLHRLADAHSRNPGYFGQDPVESFHRHVSVTPFWEDDVERLLEDIPVDRLLFGSDWPHAEGTVTPADFAAASLAWANDDIVRRIMRDNGLALVGHGSSRTI